MKSKSDRSLRLSAGVMAIATSVMLGACGGGGGSEATATSAAAPPSEAAAVADASASAAAISTGSAVPVLQDSPDQLLAQAMQATLDAPIADTAAAPGAAAAADITTTLGSEDTDATALAVAKNVATDATPRVSISISTGKVYYVDSKAGNDANSGLTAGPGASGPWRTLAKLRLTALAAGDTVRLVCGSEWREALSVGASGTAAKPITVAAFPDACAAKPLINGSVSIAASQWSQHKGSLYKASLALQPLQVYASSGSFTQAHHPNQGHDSALPASLYARLAADSDKVLVNDRPTSSFATTGTDLKLPSGAGITPGTQIRLRSIAWAIEEHTVSAVSGAKLTLAARTSYPLLAGWGYYLLGQLWMLDSAGEWHFDNASKTLYAWMPDSKAPSSPVLASQLPTGIELSNRQYITIDGLAVRMVGTGANLSGSTGVVLRNSRFEDTTEHAITAGNSVNAKVETSTFARIGMDAITGQDDILPVAAGMQVLNNNLAEIGLVMNGAVATSLPRRSRAAIRPGANATVSGNSISNTAYIGIWPLANSTVSDNLLFGTCTLLDDCGAIYISGVNNNSTISGNLVQSSRGALAGKSLAAAYTQAQGIYLDDLTSGAKVLRNTVTDADSGIHVHIASNNTITGNVLYGNRNNQLWLQETQAIANKLGDLSGNTVSANLMAPTSAAARGIYLDSVVTDTSRFGSFDQNRYFDTVNPIVAEERTPSQVTRYTLADWRAASTAGLSRSLDIAGAGTSQTRFASVMMNGSTVVPNARLATSTSGWTSWSATAPIGSLVREACSPGWCARYVAGGSAGLLSSPNFSITAGNWYRISFDAATGADGQLLNVLVRRGGGGSNGYEALSDRSLNITAGRGWKRYSAVFKSTRTVNAADPLTQDLGARVDFQNILPGQTISVTNLELVPIVAADTLTRSDLLVNASANPTQALCPTASKQPALCAYYVRLSDNQPVTWPYYLGPRGSEIIYTRDSRLVDSDGDGIPDSQDTCPNTAAGQGVNSRGCAIGQA